MNPTHTRHGRFLYPSGHSTRGTVLAAVLAELSPERCEALFEKGRKTGWRA